MMLLETLRAAAVVETAANSLWIGAVVAAAVALTLKVYAPASAATRYRVWLVAVAAIALVPAALVLTKPGAGGLAARAEAGAAAPATPGAAVDESRGLAAAAAPEPAGTALAVSVPPSFPLEAVSLALLALASAAAAFRLGLVVRGALWCRRARRGASPLPAESEARLAGWLRVRDAGRRARILVSPDAAQPMAVGFLAPAIVLPASILADLSDEDLDNIVLHELAHVRRRDDWALLAQRLLEAFYAFNPVVAWAARRLEAERELACDEWAVAVTRAPRGYAKSLLRLAELRLAPARATLAPGALERSHLSRRVESLLRIGSPGRRRAAGWVAAAVALAAFGAGAWVAPTVRVSEAAASVPSAGGAAPVELGALRAGTLGADSAASIARDDASRDDRAARAAALAALGDRAGAVIVMDPRTGRVLTIVNQEWAVRRTFSPASTTKLVTSVAGLRTGTLDPAARVKVPDFGKRLSLDEALAYSNTLYFDSVAERAGFAAILENARLVGFGEPTGIDLPGEASGRLPAEGTLSAGDFGSRGKGVEITPLQLATFISAIANGGRLLTPHLDPNASPAVRRDLSELAPAFSRLMPGMLGAVRYGTARPAFDPTFAIAGKTGTYLADGFGVGLFASFEATSPRYTVVVILAGKDVMGAHAAGVARRVYKEMGY